MRLFFFYQIWLARFIQLFFVKMKNSESYLKYIVLNDTAVKNNNNYIFLNKMSKLNLG
jgi:hypothetical protein